jgi:hypothetical protein
LTRVAFTCDTPDPQALVPQFVVGNELAFSVGTLAGLQSASPNNVHLAAQKERLEQ